MQIACIVLASACAKREGGAAAPVETGSTSTSTSTPISAPVETGAGSAAPAASAVTSSPAASEAIMPSLAPSVGAWEGSSNVRVTFTANPEPAGFPTGAFRAATKMCVGETRFAVTEIATTALELSIQGGHVRSVSLAKGDAGAALPQPLVTCLQKLYAKATLKNAPAKLPVTLTLAPGSND